MVKSAVTDLIQCYKIYCLCPTTRFWKGSKLYFPSLWSPDARACWTVCPPLSTIIVKLHAILKGVRT